MTELALTIRALRAEDDRSKFTSGDLELDRFFQRFAGQSQFKHHLGTTYVATEGGRILGFATITPSEIVPASLPESKPKRSAPPPLPVLRLTRLAVDERARGQGVGSALLRAVFALVHDLSDGLGCRGVVVDAKADAVAFFERLGFIHLELEAGQLGDRPEPVALFIERGAIPSPSTSLRPS